MTTNVVASWLHEQQPTATPASRANIYQCIVGGWYNLELFNSNSIFLF